MRLYNNLEHWEQENAFKYCIDIAIHNLLDSGTSIDVDKGDEEGQKLKESIEEAVKHAKSLETHDEQIDYLLNNKDVFDLAADMAENMCRSSIYLDHGEMAIHSSELDDDGQTDHGDGNETNDNHNVNGKKNNQLN